MISDIQLREYLKSPLTLLGLTDPKDIEQVNNLIPYSTGFEIESNLADEIETEDILGYFRTVPNIIDVNLDSCEQRFRIPNGMMGIICLYQLSRQLKRNLTLNMESGIHYHIDCKTDDSFKDLTKWEYMYSNVKWILSELDTWKYEGKYNTRGTTGFGGPNDGAWLRANDLKTLEFRVGEMTFDYDLLLKRIIHCNSIVKRLKDDFPYLAKPVFKPVDIRQVLVYEKSVHSTTNKLHMQMELINKEVAKMNEEETIKVIDPLVAIQPEVRNRLHKIDTGFNG